MKTETITRSFRQFFEVPQLGDETDHRRARLLSFLVNLHLIVATAVTILFSTIAFSSYIFPIVAIASCIPASGIRILIRNGRIRIASYIFLGFMAFLLPFAAFMGKGSVGTVTVTSFQFITIIMAGLLMEEFEVLIFVVMTLLINGGLFYAEANNFYIINIRLRDPLTLWITQVITYSTGASLVWMANGLIKESFNRAKVELAERTHAKQSEENYRAMLEKVIRLGKTVTEVSDFNTTLNRIWESVRTGLDFDRVGIFLYNPNENSMQGSIGTDRDGNKSDEWDDQVPLSPDSFFYNALIRPDGFSFTDSYDEDYNLPPDHVMAGVKQNAAVACWSGDKPIAIIVVDQLLTNRPISKENLEALRLFAGYAGLAIQNTRLNSELEERVRERERFIEELGMRNAELERFSYTVSHELKSPIVTIKNFLGIIDRDLNLKNYESAQKDFYRIMRATNKMHDTLSDLLELSRIGRIVNPYETINVSELVQEALETVHGRVQDRRIVVETAASFPSVHGDRVRLREVFENLIDNAAKYSGEQKSPVIEIGIREGKEAVFYVKDNGLGIAPQYHARIFNLFDKLDPNSDGTGVGLALIKRIVEVHGGKIWVESEGLGRGSTFCFTIPNNNMEDK